MADPARTGPDPRPVIGISPFGAPDAGLVAAVVAGGGTGVLDPGPDRLAGRSVVRRAAELCGREFGVRLRAGGALSAADVAEIVTEVAGGPPALLMVDGEVTVAPGQAGRVLAEVTTTAEARDAVAAGAAGLVLRGGEAAGRVGDLGAYTLLQEVMAAGFDVPVWVCGGIGEHTAAGAVAGGAAGVVLDTQLALLDDAATDPAVARALLRPETVVLHGVRVLDLVPGTPAAPNPAPETAGALAAELADPHGRYRPCGQDAGLAARFAATYPDVASAVRGIAAAMADAPAGRVRGGLDPTTALPVAQGPMTRVSDRPGFAASVAAHGGLPFVAVALSDGASTARLLADTAATVGGGGRWGAGILGFLDEELHTAQMAAVRAARPPAVLVAGGRPGQAAILEADGIPAYLHVPSPVLLEQFLAAGVRRFVFEGAECGGHLGPQNSFVLWETQLGVLEKYLENHSGDGIEIYLAGGVHDARSAAIVSAMTAPLVARGVRAGVLMGTAYLFTAEAVEHGAITSLFQEQAVAATGTAIVETAPGHRTRCLDTPFVAQFHETAAALADRPARERWAALEDLNTGRLRIASKGLRRDGNRIVEVGDAEQLASGMYMAGQVAALRTAVTDVAALHADVTTGAAALLAARPAPSMPTLTRPRQEPLDIAVIGMACAFPQAPDLDAYWALALAGTDAVTEVPRDRFDASFYDVTSRWGAFLPGIGFDPLSFGIPPASMGSIDPSQLLSLEIARRALHDAGYRDRPFDRERTGVVFGAEAGSDLADANTLRALLPGYLEQLPEELTAQLPQLTEDSFPGTLANVIAGRIANRLDLGGTNFTVDAACGSSLAAVASACRELTVGAADLMLCGAVDLHNGVNDYLLFSSVGALSPTGACRPFSAAADGIALGEGVACVVLKRLADAQRDGDTVHAVIRGLGASSDGRSLGLTAPRPEGQRRALERAYAQAGISPADVGLVEAHGTGTVVGDATELRALTAFFSEHGAAPGSCALTSVKSQIGHTKCAAGLAGLIRTTLALGHGVIPPLLHQDEPNAAWDIATSPFTFGHDARPWATPRAERVAGVSAFGFGGTNFHVVLSAPPRAPRHPARTWPAELVLISGADDAAVAARAAQLRDLVGTGSLADLAHTAALMAAADRAPVRRAVVAGDPDRLRAALSAVAAGRPDPAVITGEPAESGRVAFLFSGQGSQRTGMLAELFLHDPALRDVLDDARAWTDTIYPAHAFGTDVRDAQDAALRDTTVAQPALGAVETGLRLWLDGLGVRPDVAAGHSYGELVALAAAGCFDTRELLRLSAARANAILDAAGDDPGAMAAVRAGTADVEAALTTAGLDGAVVAANRNSPRQTVVSGPTAALEQAVAALRDAGIAATRIPVACAFHSPVVAGATDAFSEVLSTADVAAPRLPVYANTTAAPYPADAGAVRRGLAAQLGAPVRWAETVEALYADGVRTFVEVGPGRTLTGLVGEILGDRPHTAVATGGRPGLSGLLEAVGRLALAGLPVRLDRLFRGRGCRDLRISAPAKPLWKVDGRHTRRADGTYPDRGLVPATRIRGGLVPEQHDPVDPRDRLVADYLAATRELVAAQRDVLLGYLGATPAAPAPLRTVITAPPAALPAAPMPLTVPVTVTVPVSVTIPEPAPAAPLDVAPLDVAATVVAVIGERTGYPPEMIDAELDLEADLSIDSIKRTEIAGLLVDRVGLGGRLGGTEQDELGRLRTTGAMTEWLRARIGGAPAAAESAPTVVITPGDAVTVKWTPPALGRPPLRHVVTEVTVPGGPATDLTGTPVAVHGEAGGLAGRLRAMLAGTGAVPALGLGSVLDERHSRHIGHDESAVRSTGWALVDLTPLGPSEESLVPAVALRIRDAVAAGAVRVLVAARRSAGGELPAHAAGLRGLMRAVALEHPDVTMRLVELPASDAGGNDADPAALVLLAELRMDGPVVVGYGPAGRTTPHPVHAELSAAAPLRAVDGGVVLLIGGARGIAAQAAVALAEAGHHVELAGRGARPEDAGADPGGDAAALRRTFAGQGMRLADVEGRVRAVLAGREVAATLEAVRATGREVTYHQLDVRDDAAVHQLVKDVLNRHGRLDGVVLAAGVLADKLLADAGTEADEAAWRAVFATKADGAAALFGALEEVGARPGWVALFGSVAAVLGNRGQTAYAAANDAQADLGAAWARRTGGRVVTVHWGPWAPSPTHPGMVTEELAREYGRRGIELIDPAAGVAALLAEVAEIAGTGGGQVLLAASPAPDRP